MRESLRMVVVLTVVAMISGGVLSQVYNYTNEIISANRAREIEKAVYEVLPGIESVRTIEPGPETMVEEDRSTLRDQAGNEILIFEGLDGNGEPVGFAFLTEGTGYGGTIRVLVGVDSESQEIISIKILEHVETPGLGSRVEGEGFRNQFVGKTANDPLEVGQDIDKISGATVSSRAVTDAVRKGVQSVVPLYEGRK